MNKERFERWLNRCLEVTIERELEAEGQRELFTKTHYAAQREILLLASDLVREGKFDD